MNGVFLLNIILLVFINLLIKPLFIFGIDLSVQNRVGEDYGLYFTLLNLTYVFQIVNDFGLQNFNSRNISQHPHLLPKYFPNFLVIKLLLSLVYVFFTLFTAAVMLGYDAHQLPLLLVLLCNNVLIQMILFLRSNVSGLAFYGLDSFLSTLDKLLSLFLGAILISAAPFGLEVTIMNFALTQTLSLALTLVIVFLLLHSKVHFSIRPSWVRNWRAGLPVLVFLFKKSVPYALVILLMFAYSRLDAVLLERLLPYGVMHAEVYAGAYRLLDASNMLGYLFAGLLLPMFARLLHSGGTEAVKPLVSLSFKLIWAGSITLAAAVFFAREPLVRLMMPERATAYRWDTLGILIWVFVPVSVIYIFSTLLTASEKLMAMNRFFVIGIVMDVTLNLVLVPHWKALGSAVATLCTHIFVAGAVTWLCFRQFELRAQVRTWVQVVGFAVSVVGGDWLLFQYVPGGGLGKMILALLFGMLMLFATRLVTVKLLRNQL